MKNFQWVLVCSCFLLLSSCQNTKPKKSTISTEKTELVYAQNFTIEKGEGYTILTVLQPDNRSQVFSSYLLYSQQKPSELYGCNYAIKVPVKSVAALSTTHIGFLDFLQETASIVGVTDPFRIFNSDVNTALKAGRIKGLGDSMNPDAEKLFLLAPDVIFKSGFGNIKAQDKRIAQANIPIAYSYSWKENTALARMEWIKFFACFYQKEMLADSLFNEVSKKYDQLKNLVKEHEGNSPSIIAGSNFKGTWYVPGGGSYIATMIKEAGGNYIFKNDSSVGSLTVSIEAIYENGKDADFWINGGEENVIRHTLSDSRMQNFGPIKSGNIYSQMLRVTPGGGNAYWETGIVHPEWVLADLVKIFHPDILPEHSMKYYKKIALK